MELGGLQSGVGPEGVAPHKGGHDSGWLDARRLFMGLGDALDLSWRILNISTSNQPPTPSPRHNGFA